ncbi:MAG: hypothetical protein IT428_32110 [Planctomycetaceae bacterium]|nr:hypothetical protein [Planctomycetaceae bacterium]
MIEANETAVLEQLLIDVARSLLQYVGECWAWSSTDARSSESTQSKIEALVKLQGRGVERLANLLATRVERVDFGAYPTEYTDLHYCALDYLLLQLQSNTSELIRSIESAINAYKSDSAATPVLESVAADHRKILDELKNLRVAKAMLIA